MVLLPGFLSGVATIPDTAPPEGKALRTCVYRLASQEHLDAYFRDHAERMRADGMRRFGGKFSATRRVLRVVHASSK
jgi:hypothetical protein